MMAGRRAPPAGWCLVCRNSTQLSGGGWGEMQIGNRGRAHSAPFLTASTTRAFLDPPPPFLHSPVLCPRGRACPAPRAWRSGASAPATQGRTCSPRGRFPARMTVRRGKMRQEGMEWGKRGLCLRFSLRHSSGPSSIYVFLRLTALSPSGGSFSLIFSRFVRYQRLAYGPRALDRLRCVAACSMFGCTLSWVLIRRMGCLLPFQGSMMRTC